MSYPVELAKPFNPRFVRDDGRGNSYVPHGVIEQKLILTLGLPPNFELKEIVRGDVPAVSPDPKGTSRRAREGVPALTNVIVGVVARMETEFADDSFPGGWRHRVEEEAGDCEDPHNWKTDGARLKDAASDAYKRCAMRLGAGLHLWGKPDDFILYQQLSMDKGEATPTRESATAGSAAARPGPAPGSPPGWEEN